MNKENQVIIDNRVERVLNELDLKRPNYWNVPRSTGEFLYELVRILDARRILEIGTSNGYSGIFLASALKSLGERRSALEDEGLGVVGKLFTVESHQERFEEARENFGRAGLSEYVWQVRGHAPEVLLEGGDEGLRSEFFDLVFIDATKMEYESYLEAVLPVLRPGGLIVADNCLSHAEDLGEFFEYVREHMNGYLLPLDNGLLFISKWRSFV